MLTWRDRLTVEGMTPIVDAHRGLTYRILRGSAPHPTWCEVFAIIADTSDRLANIGSEQPPNQAWVQYAEHMIDRVLASARFEYQRYLSVDNLPWAIHKIRDPIVRTAATAAYLEERRKFK